MQEQLMAQQAMAGYGQTSQEMAYQQSSELYQQGTGQQPAEFYQQAGQQSTELYQQTVQQTGESQAFIQQVLGV